MPWWTPKKQEKESEQRRTRDEDNPEDARTCRRQPGELPESSGFNSVERISGPGEHTNEPATLQEKRGQARYGNSGRGRKERVRKEDTGTAHKGKGGRWWKETTDCT
ncbi:hypothetical protein NDU88_000684 [Pleurodeles waltl]|uniref:Uncharacterized protein n=1 Tax=Pleurodeles waltl TaxID=8319 RepID=A0AAV7PAD7_PLEWA|nr:hypothetical protein NDU88_000684 [Pleurodeles waltl]